MTRDSHFDRAAARRAEEQQRGARGKLIRRLVEQHVARHGIEPDDAYLSMVLGCSLAKIAKYRRLAT